MEHTPKIVEAVGIGNRPGMRTLQGDLGRLLKRLFFWLLVCRWITRIFGPWPLTMLSRFGRYVCGSRILISGASKGNSFENDILKLFFNATAIADLAQDDGTSPATTLSVALHTADPGEAGTQATSETAYTGYSRVTVARTTGGWTVTNNSVSPVANIDFGECTASAGAAITHFSIGTGVSNYLMYSGTVTPNITMAVGVIPRLKTTSTITED